MGSIPRPVVRHLAHHPQGCRSEKDRSFETFDCLLHATPNVIGTTHEDRDDIGTLKHGERFAVGDVCSRGAGCERHGVDVNRLHDFGAVLCGMAAARLAKASGALETLAGVPVPRWSGVLGLAGRHSLLVYLVHQPVLIAALFVFSQVAPPESETLQVQFRQSCEARCAQDRSEEFCAFYCMCVLDEIERENMLDAVFSERQDAATEAKVDEIATACVGSALERGG